MFKNVEIFIIIKNYNFKINLQKIRAVKNKNFYFLIFRILFIFVNKSMY